MASIRGSNTSPERAIRVLLHSLGYRFRLHRKDLPGRPDIVLPRHQLAILVHGCFWHQHTGCRYATVPQSNKKFWREKLRGNVQRDSRVLENLSVLGWRTLVIWECNLKSESTKQRLTQRLDRAVKSRARHAEVPRQPTR